MRLYALIAAPHRNLSCLAAGAEQHILGLYVRMNDLHALIVSVHKDVNGPLLQVLQNTCENPITRLTSRIPAPCVHAGSAGRVRRPAQVRAPARTTATLPHQGPSASSTDRRPAQQEAEKLRCFCSDNAFNAPCPRTVHPPLSRHAQTVTSGLGVDLIRRAWLPDKARPRHGS